MHDWLEYAPTDYRDVIRRLPAGWHASERVVDPIILISRTGKGFRLDLAGRRTVRGEAKTWNALSPDHNWVPDNVLIRPLPYDAPQVVREILSGRDHRELSFADVVSLVRLEHLEIPVEPHESVFLPGKEAAQDLDEKLTVPGLNATLYSYQARGVAWMLRTLRHTGGVILADEMGLGKTIQIISLLLLEGLEDEERPALIVCPSSLLANWRREIFRFAPELSVLIHRGYQRTGVVSGFQRAQVVLATYDTVVNDRAIFTGLRWRWLVFDEAQAVKNPDSIRRQVIGSLQGEFTVPMTGTPVETSLRDLWSLMDLAIPQLLGSRKSFERNFPDTELSAKKLSLLTDPVILRRRVKDVANDLPERIQVDVPLELGEELCQRYNDLREEILQKYPVAGALVVTGQLQIFCAHPWLQGLGGNEADEDAVLVRSPDVPLLTPKMERAVSIIEEAFLSRKKVLLFSIFNGCGDLIRSASGSASPAFWGAINGSTPQEQRQELVDAFSAYDGPGCLVMNPRAAGTGLNITAATIVIHFTLSWNPALETQASARAHRRGQTEPVYVYRLFYENTIERIMIDRSEWRNELGNEAVPISSRDEDDLRRALALAPEV